MICHYSYTKREKQFHITVRDGDGRIVYESLFPTFYEDDETGDLIPESSIIEDGIMSDMGDIEGLKKYLMVVGLIGEGDDLVIGNTPINDSGKYDDGGQTSIELKNRANKLLEGSFELPIEVSVLVPSTEKANRIISKRDFEMRYETVATYLSSIFGGYSANPVDGGYVSDKKGLIQEDIKKVVAFASNDSFRENFKNLVKKIKDWCDLWSQEAIGLEVEGDLYYVSSWKQDAKNQGKTIKDVKTAFDKIEFSRGGGLGSGSQSFKVREQAVAKAHRNINQVQGYGRMSTEDINKKPFSPLKSTDLPLDVYLEKRAKGEIGNYGGKRMEDGGEVYVDLFEYPELMPVKVKRIYNRYMKKFGDMMDYKDTQAMLDEMEGVGYTFDYYLDNVGYGLRPVGVKLGQLQGWEEFADEDEDEYANGGIIKVYANNNRGKELKVFKGNNSIEEAKEYAIKNKSKYNLLTFEKEIGDSIVVSKEDSIAVIDFLFSDNNEEEQYITHGSMMAKGGSLDFKVGDKFIHAERELEIHIESINGDDVVVDTYSTNLDYINGKWYDSTKRDRYHIPASEVREYISEGVWRKKIAFANGGEIRKHKHQLGLTIKLIEPTNKGWKVEQTETHKGWSDTKLRKPKVKIAFYSTKEINELFEPVMARGGQIDKKYTHFAVRKSDNKIVNGWDYKGLDKSEIKYWTDMDLKDDDLKPSDFKILSKEFLIRQGIDPFNISNWRNLSEETNMERGGITGDVDSLTSKVLSNRIKKFLKEIEIRYYFIDAKTNTLRVGISDDKDSKYFDFVADKIAENKAIFKEDSWELVYDREGELAEYSIEIKSPVKFEDGGYMADGGVVYVLYGTKDGEPDYMESILFEDTEPIKITEKLKSILADKGYGRLRVSKIDLSTPPDFSKTINRKKAGDGMWIQKAIKHKGALRKEAKREGLIKGDEKLSATDLKKLAKKEGKTGKRVKLAQTLARLRERKKMMASSGARLEEEHTNLDTLQMFNNMDGIPDELNGGAI